MPFLLPYCWHLLVDCCVPPLLHLFPRRYLPPPLPLLAADVIGNGGDCDFHFLAKEAAAVAMAVREIFLRGDV
jgi:hypothetical protein